MYDKMKVKVPVDKFLNHKEKFENHPFFEAEPINKDGNYMPVGKSSDENFHKVACAVQERLAP